MAELWSLITAVLLIGLLVDYVYKYRRHFESAEQPIPLATLRPSPLYSLTPETLNTYNDRPWRPFRWPYHQTMSIFRLDINHWLDMDKWYMRYIREKQRILEEHDTAHCDWLPESQEACEELLDTVVEHLTLRYPNLFERTKNGVHNLITDEVISLVKPHREHPLKLVSRLAKEDFYIVQQREDGRHYLVAGAVPFPGGEFSVASKLGKHLDVIHSDVPYYDEKLKSSMERWFSKLKPEEPVERATWYITWDHQLLMSKLYQFEGEKLSEGDVNPTDYVVRVERQTLRRLPKSNAIIFTNHPIFYSIEEMKDEPGMPSLLKTIIEHAPEKIHTYKQFPLMMDHIIPYIDSLITRQVDAGIIEPDHTVKTLSTYPFAQWIKSSTSEQGWTNPASCNIN